MDQQFRHVDPSDLRLPMSRAAGADAWKLHRQVRQYGASMEDMPPLLAYEDPDGLLIVIDGVTRATRVAKLAPGKKVSVHVIGKYRKSRKDARRIGDTL
jgi:hypothetical protein